MTPKKYPQNLHTPKKYYFSENPKNIEIQNFEPPKMTRAYVCMKISEYPPGDQKAKFQLFQNMVMMHIKLNGITKCNNMVANILPTDPPNDPRGQKIKTQLCQNMVMLHNKLNGIMKTATW